MSSLRSHVDFAKESAGVVKEHKPVTGTEFEYYQDFWDFCFYACPSRGLALEPHSFCAGSCEHRRRLGIPPHGLNYDGKIRGKIE